jgi:hypothetical protein
MEHAQVDQQLSLAKSSALVFIDDSQRVVDSGINFLVALCRRHVRGRVRQMQQHRPL